MRVDALYSRHAFLVLLEAAARRIARGAPRACSVTR
jgi:hypothetical protein